MPVTDKTTHVRALNDMGHSSIHRVKPGQASNTPWRDLLCLNAWEDVKAGYRRLEEWLAKTNDYYAKDDVDDRRVKFDDVTSEVAKAGGRFTDDDGHRPILGLDGKPLNLSVYAQGDDLDLCGLNLSGFNRLAVNAGANVVLRSGGRVRHSHFEKSNAGAIRVKGVGARIEGVSARNMALRGFDTGFVYIEGKRSDHRADCRASHLILSDDGSMPETRAYSHGKQLREYHRWLWMADDAVEDVSLVHSLLDGGGKAGAVLVNEGTNHDYLVHIVNSPVPVKVNGYGDIRFHPDSTVDGRALRRSDIETHGKPTVRLNSALLL